MSIVIGKDPETSQRLNPLTLSLIAYGTPNFLKMISTCETVNIVLPLWPSSSRKGCSHFLNVTLDTVPGNYPKFYSGHWPMENFYK